MERWLKQGTLKRPNPDIESLSPSTSQDHNMLTEVNAPEKSCSANKKESGQNKNKNVNQKIRKYDESYIRFGFTFSNNNLQCVVCGKIFPNSSMAPAKMRRHLETVHVGFQDKNVDFFKRKRDKLMKAQMYMTQAAHTVNEKATEASFLVSYKIAQAGEAHTIAENLIKPCAISMVKCVIDEKSAKEISKIPLSNDTVARRINELATNVKDQLIQRIRSCRFALQMDESTDVAGLAILLVFVRYQYENSLSEDLLLCKPLPAHTTGAEIFNLLNSFINDNEVPWENCIDVCTDGAKAMLGKLSRAVQRVKQLTRNCTSSHCMIHREALATKKLPLEFKNVLDEVVKIINFIKARPLNNRLFKILCDDMGSVHSSLLLHTEVRWLSRGKVLARFVELREELRGFFFEHDCELKNRLNDKQWMFREAYLGDIFAKLNEINFALQGKQVNVFTASEKIQAFKKKLQFWIGCVDRQELDCFPALKDVLEEESIHVNTYWYKEVSEHLQNLSETFEQYFPNEYHKKLEHSLWIKNPFIIDEKLFSLSNQEYEKFLELTSDSSLSSAYKTKPLTEFWCSLKDEYPQLTEQAILVPTNKKSKEVA